MIMLNDIDHSFNSIDFAKLKPLSYKSSIITIGNFDGVHLGHQAIITKALEKAQSKNQPVILLTFFPNPFDYFNPHIDSVYLSTPHEREVRLLELGVDRVITFCFDRDFAELSARKFLTGLKRKLGLSALVVGQDFVLGKNRQGTIPVLKAIGTELSFTVETITPVQCGGQEISSTAIRQLLDRGQVADAAEMLGQLYAIDGEVIHGSDRGSKIGLPTANLSYWARKKLPAVGVYATIVTLLGQDYRAITNIGFRPTFEDQATRNIETHILNFDGNIYGENLILQFIRKIRDEEKFSGVEAFLAQIERDKLTARRIFSEYEA
jgi:riboflavin kinase / FMN adenylyltransferase